MLKFLTIFLLMLISDFTQAQEFKITTYNLFLLPQAVNRYQLLRAPFIADYLLKNNSDVFVLQECFNNKAIDIINGKVKSNYPYQFKDTSNNILKLCSGLWIISKYPILEHHFQTYGHCSSWDCLAQKGCAEITICFHGSLIQIFGTHLNATSNQETRDYQYQEMADFIKKYSLDELQILAGDMNTIKSNSIGYNNMIKMLGVQNYTTDYLSYNARQNNLHDEFINGVIDYIFVKNSLIDNIIKRYADTPKADWDPSGIHKDLSDHYPIILQINLDK